MANANRQKGSKYETALVELCHSLGLEAHRLPISSPKGDIQIRGCTLPIEAKNQKASRLGYWATQARAEARCKGTTHWAIFHHIAGNGDISQDYATMPVATALTLLKIALEAGCPI